MARVQFRPIGVTAQTIHALVKAKETDALALYMAYFEISDWQKAQRVKATTGFMAKRLGWSDSRVQKNKKILTEMGLIADHKDLDETNNQIKGWYIAIYHLVDDITPQSFHPSQIPGGGIGQGVENLGTSAINVNKSAINVNEVSFSNENDTSNNKLRSNFNLRDSIKEEEPLYDSVAPVDSEGNEIAPRKKPEKANMKEAQQVYVQFASACVKMGLPQPAPATAWQLKQVWRGVKEIGGRDRVDDLLAYFFAEASDETILNIHTAFSSHTINKWRGSQHKRKPMANPKYDKFK